jgi:hypothetical protein
LNIDADLTLNPNSNNPIANSAVTNAINEISAVRLEYTATESLADIQPCDIEYSKHEYNDETGKGVFIYNEAPTSIQDYTFEGCTLLTSITIPESVTYIGEGAFADCTSLTSISIPDSVTEIGDYAISYCSSLSSIIIPDSVTTINSDAFRDCASLTSVIIGNSVTSISGYAFAGCTSLINVYCKSTTPPTNNDAFYGLYGIKICVPINSLDAYKAATN